MPELLHENAQITDIKDTETTVKSKDKKKNKDKAKMRKITMSNSEFEMIITGIPGALKAFTLGGMEIVITTQQTTLEEEEQGD